MANEKYDCYTTLMKDSNIHPFWHPTDYAQKRDALLLRTKLKSEIRAFFEKEDFLEVETGIVQFSPGNETHLHGFSCFWRDFQGDEHRAFLHTSPEFAMKKLLAAGEKRIFQFSPVFRAREDSPLHSAAFTMLEWYRAGEEYSALMDDCASLLNIAAKVAGKEQFQWRDRKCNITNKIEKLSVEEAFSIYAGVSLNEIFGEVLCTSNKENTNELSESEINKISKATGMRIAIDDNRSDVFSRILSEKIEPNLGIGSPTILDLYPISEAALAKPCDKDPRFAQRFELYICGIEMANAFGELTNQTEQRTRFIKDMDEKMRIYGEEYPIDEDFLSAMSFMPQSSGIALGFDRLAMLTASKESVDEVMFETFNL